MIPSDNFHSASGNFIKVSHRKHLRTNFPTKPLAKPIKQYKTAFRWFPFQTFEFGFPVSLPLPPLLGCDVPETDFGPHGSARMRLKMFRFWDQNLTTWKVQMDLKLYTYNRSQMSSDHQVILHIFLQKPNSQPFRSLWGVYVQMYFFPYQSVKNYEILRISGFLYL